MNQVTPLMSRGCAGNCRQGRAECTCWRDTDSEFVHPVRVKNWGDPYEEESEALTRDEKRQLWTSGATLLLLACVGIASYVWGGA